MAQSISLVAATGVEAEGRGGASAVVEVVAGGRGGAPAVIEEAAGAGADERRRSPRRRRVLRPSGTSSSDRFCRMGLSRIWEEYSSLGTNPSHSLLNQKPLKVGSFYPIPSYPTNQTLPKTLHPTSGFTFSFLSLGVLNRPI
uniref:Uncharacterized protein n=1 Tax=Oryza glumipatula TaxID=40148 RepID=A0A0E0AU50_9ORYZ